MQNRLKLPIKVIHSSIVKLTLLKPVNLGALQRLEKLHKSWFDNCTFTDQYTVAQRGDYYMS